MWDIIREWSDQNAWVMQVFLVVLAVLFFDFAQRLLLARLERKLQETPNPWDDALIHALQRPLSLFIWVVGIAFAAEIVGNETGSAIFGAVTPARDLGVIGSIAWFLVRLTSNVQANVIAAGKASDPDYDRTTADAVGKLVRASIVITTALVALQTLGFSVSGVLAFGGVGGIAVGFAAKDLLANFFGGLMIYLDRPFSVGDWIRSPDREIEGTVEHIGWRLTRIRTFDKRPVYVPNSMFATIAVENPSRMSNRRIFETIGIRYDDADKMEAIVAEVEAMLKAHPEIDTTKTLMVHFDAFAPSSLDFFVYAFTRTIVWTTFHQIKQDILLKIYGIIVNHGAEVAFPTSTLHVPEEIRVGPLGESPAAATKT